MQLRSLIRILLPAFAGAALLTSAPAPAPAQTPRVVEITAKRFGFTPNQLTLKRGETVTLRLTSEDVTHGLFVRPLKIDTTIEPGHTSDITITPQQAGTFTAICDHFCGVNHGAMHMAITVTE